MKRGHHLLLVVPIVAALAGIAVAAPGSPVVADAVATALVAQVTLPGQPPSATVLLAGPPTATGGGPFSYPEDGSILRVAASNASVTAQAGLSSAAQGTAEVLAVSIFGGEITASSLNVIAGAAAGASSSSADSGTPTISGLTVLGVAVAGSPGAQAPLADWGTLEVLASSSTIGTEPRSAESTVTGLRVRLIVEHGGLPPGSEILVGAVTARAVAQPAPVTAPTLARPRPAVQQPPPPPPPPKPPPNAPKEPGRSEPGGAPPEIVRPAPDVTAALTQGGYVFPVFGPASFGDSFGAPRPNVSGGWHHGEDIGAPLGTPLLAVADGTLFSVGWNDIGGWRLWLRDALGNEFYYAHLSAYAPVAVEGGRVKAGAVIGFVGKTGDAEASIPHLHFEIHPAALLGLGYDGAVAPYPFLVAWRRADDVSFGSGRRYLPGEATGRPVALARAGAVLLEAHDISSASGLVPGALERALAGGETRSRTKP